MSEVGYLKLLAGETFAIENEWLDNLDSQDRAALAEMAWVRYRGDDSTILQARQHRVGLFNVGGRSFVLRHQIPLQLVLAMAFYADGRSLRAFDKADLHGAGVEKDDVLLSDLLASLLAREAQSVATRSLYARYERKSDRIQVLRGRVLWEKSFASPGQLGLPCEFHERATDVLENQVVLAALARARTWRLQALDVQRRVSEQSHVWASVCSSQAISVEQLNRLEARANRLNEHYRTVLSLSGAVLNDVRGLKEDGGSRFSSSLWLDVPNVFERFVAELIRRGIHGDSVSIEVQPTNRSALLDEMGWTYRAVRPDLILRKNGVTHAVVDMKAKPRYANADPSGRPEERVLTSDIFQLLFYAEEARKASDRDSVPGFVVAPALDESRTLHNRFRLIRWVSPELGGERTLRLCPLPVRSVFMAIQSGTPEEAILHEYLPEIVEAMAS